MNYKPYPYQRYAENFILEHDEAGLFLEMGLGKTVITLTALEKLKWDIGKVLVIAPKKPITDTWPQEIEKWPHLKDLTYSLVVGTPAQRSAALRKDAYIYLINRENLVWLVKQYGKTKWPFDCVVVDELSSFKSAKAQRFKALKRVRPFIKRIVGLTGTPAGHGFMDLWAEAFVLDGGKALGRTLTGYRDQYFRPGRRNGHIVYDWLLKDGAEEAIMKKLEPLCISMKTEDYIDLPERLDLVKTFELSEKNKKLYKEMEKNMLLSIDESTIDAVNAAALTGKLLQLCGGAVYDEDGLPVDVHEDKLEMLDSLIEEAEGESVLIFYAFRHERDRIMRRYPEAVDVKEPDAVKRWNEGKIKILLAHPASAGHGLNLQFGGSISIWYGLTSSLELYQQACKRLHRMGQKSAVRNFVLLAKGTYDEIVYYNILQPKAEVQNAILLALKARIKEVQDGHQAD